MREELGYPVFVKPAELGSSVGISRAVDDGSFKDAVHEALRHGDKVIVEEEVSGREIEVAVLEGPRASVPGEIVISGWYTYDAKYQDDATTLLVPAPLSEQRHCDGAGVGEATPSPCSSVAAWPGWTSSTRRGAAGS